MLCTQFREVRLFVIDLCLQWRSNISCRITGAAFKLRNWGFGVERSLVSGTWQSTFVVRLHSTYGLVPLQLSFLPLAQHLLLEVSHRLQEVLALHVWGWNDDAAVQEFIDTVQEVLSVVGKVGHLVETLQPNTTGCHQQKLKKGRWSSKDLVYRL